MFASANPDGLEWSMEKVAGTTELDAKGAAYQKAADIQEWTALLPDYAFKTVRAWQEHRFRVWQELR